MGAYQLLAKDAAGVRIGSATTKSATGLGSTGNATSTGATSPQDQ
ncbi:MAG: hypothetical protein ACRYFK_07200 [Janthinobacterium lividum]